MRINCFPMNTCSLKKAKEISSNRGFVFEGKKLVTK